MVDCSVTKAKYSWNALKFSSVKESVSTFVSTLPSFHLSLLPRLNLPISEIWPTTQCHLQFLVARLHEMFSFLRNGKFLLCNQVIVNGRKSLQKANGSRNYFVWNSPDIDFSEFGMPVLVFIYMHARNS